MTERQREIMELRSAGKTYKAIANELGVTTQYIAQVCGKCDSGRFRLLTEEKVMYPNLRKWMNDNKVSKKCLTIRMGYTPMPGNVQRIGGYLSGKSDPPKKVIDLLLKVTGLKYEEMFAEENRYE